MNNLIEYAQRRLDEACRNGEDALRAVEKGKDEV